MKKSFICLKNIYRNSGGGTVYHDQGNINCTFFTKRAQYERRRNLDLLCSALRRTTALDINVNEREDIVLDGTHKECGIRDRRLGS